VRRPGGSRALRLALLAAAALPLASRAAPRESRYDAEIDRATAAAASIYPVPKPLVEAVIRAESGFDPEARSRAGAVGLMQLMPATARRVGVSPGELRDPARNVLGGVRLLAVLLRHYRGDVISALVAYNASPRPAGAPIPRNGETPAYVRAVLENLRRYQAAGGRVSRGAGSPGPRAP